jgi:Polysaccharide deacetylase
VVGSADWDASGFPGPVPAAYKLERSDFERHLAAVSAAVGRRGTVRDLLGGEPASGTGQPPVLLTFDDGGASACSVADLLERAGWRGHFLITTDYIGTAGFVTRAEVRELASRGHVIGTHTCSHPTPMARYGWDRLVEEWSRSARLLADLLGQPVEVGSVPGGAFSRRVGGGATALPPSRWLPGHRPLRASPGRDARPGGGARLRSAGPAPQAAVCLESQEGGEGGGGRLVSGAVGNPARQPYQPPRRPMMTGTVRAMISMSSSAD